MLLLKKNDIQIFLKICLGTFCEQVFDGILCWPQTPAGSIGIQKCPSYMYAVLPHGE